MIPQLFFLDDEPAELHNPCPPAGGELIIRIVRQGTRPPYSPYAATYNAVKVQACQFTKKWPYVVFC